MQSEPGQVALAHSLFCASPRYNLGSKAVCMMDFLMI